MKTYIYVSSDKTSPRLIRLNFTLYKLTMYCIICHSMRKRWTGLEKRSQTTPEKLIQDYYHSYKIVAKSQV